MNPGPWEDLGPRNLRGPRTLRGPKSLWGPRTLRGPRTLWGSRTLGGSSTLWEYKTLWGLRTQNPRKTQDPSRNQDSIWIWDFKGFTNLWQYRTQIAKVLKTQFIRYYLIPSWLLISGFFFSVYNVFWLISDGFKNWFIFLLEVLNIWGKGFLKSKLILFFKSKQYSSLILM